MTCICFMNLLYSCLFNQLDRSRLTFHRKCTWFQNSFSTKIPTTHSALPYLNEPPTSLHLSSQLCIVCFSPKYYINVQSIFKGWEINKPLAHCLRWSLCCHENRKIGFICSYKTKRLSQKKKLSCTSKNIMKYYSSI